MKTIRYIFLAMTLVSVTFLLSCGDDDNNPTPEEVEIERLSGTWATGIVTLDGTDVTDPTYTDFTITFRDDLSFTTTNGAPIFGSGFWEFSDDNFTTITMDGVSVTIEYSNDDGSLSMSFNAAGDQIGARPEGLTGSYIFNLVAQ